MDVAAQESFPMKDKKSLEANHDTHPFIENGRQRWENKAEEENSEVERQQWGTKIEYLLAMIGYCVGLGNVWRFPYICIRNGGGKYVITFGSTCTWLPNGTHPGLFQIRFQYILAQRAKMY